MKRIFNIFLLSVMVLFSAITSASDSDYEENYVSVNPIVNTDDLEQIRVEGRCAAVNFNGEDVVHPQDFSICENDISYSILSMVFQKVFSENPILVSLTEGENLNEELAYAYNIGGPIIAIIEAVTWLTFTLSGIVLTFVTIKTLNISASSGQFMGNWSSVYVMTRTLTAMAVIVPIGSFSIAQIVILVFSLFAIMGGNYIWGAFLSMQQANSIALEEAGGIHTEMALDHAEKLVEMQTCSLRSSSAAYEQKQNNLSPKWFDASAKTHYSRLGACTRNSYYVGIDQVFSDYSETTKEVVANAILGPIGGNLVSPENAFPISTFALGSPSECEASSDITNSYDEKTYGSLYQCGSVSFSTADLEQFVDSDAEVADEDWFTSTKMDVVETVSQTTTSLEPNDLFESSYLIGYNNAYNGNAFNPDQLEGEIEKLSSLLVDKGKNLFAKVKTNIESSSVNPPAAYESVYVALSASFNNYLGGNYKEKGYADFWQKFKSVDFEGLGFSVNNAVQIYTKYETEIALNPMYKYSKVAAFHLMSAHCADIWGDYVQSHYNAVKGFEKLKEYHTSPSFLGNDYEDMKNPPNINAECIALLSDEEKSDDAFVISHLGIAGQAIDDGLIDSSGVKPYIAISDTNGALAILTEIVNDGELNEDAIDTAVHEIKTNSIKEARSILMGITSYNYVVREAFERALEEIFLTETETDLLLDMRELGWASAGGFILSIANEGGQLNKYNKMISNQVSWSSNVSNDKYLHSSLSSDTTFTSIKGMVDKVITGSKVGEYSSISERDTYQISAQQIARFLEDLLTAPLSHLKSVGGFDQNKSLREGAKECYEQGNCTITSVHPVTALLNVGNDLIELCFTLGILKLITGALVWAANSPSSHNKGTGESGSGGSFKLFQKILGSVANFGIMKIFFAIVEVLDVILGLLMVTVLPPLFIVGIFFSFVIPMMPFLAFLMGFIGWIMLILELLIAVNVWILLMATPDQNGSSRADPRAVFSFAGQLLLKPALMVIALIFGWYLSSISVYFLNMTIFGALSPTETNSIFGFLDLVMFYVIYLIMIFVAIKHSFKIIEALPDKIFSLLNIQRTGDVKSESLGMERLVQLAAGERVFSMLQTANQKIDRGKENAKFELKKLKEHDRKMNEGKAFEKADQEERARQEYEKAKRGDSDSNAGDKSDEMSSNESKTTILPEDNKNDSDGVDKNE